MPDELQSAYFTFDLHMHGNENIGQIGKDCKQNKEKIFLLDEKNQHIQLSYMINNLELENLFLVKDFHGIALSCFHVNGALDFAEIPLSHSPSKLILSDPVLKLHSPYFSQSI